MCARHFLRLVEDIREIVREIDELQICSEIHEKLQDYFELLDALSHDVHVDVKHVARMMLHIVNKSIHSENYSSADIFLQYLLQFFRNLFSYIVKYNNTEKKRAQDVDVYETFCEQLFIQSTPCFELMSEQIIEFTANIREETEKKIDPRDINFGSLLTDPELRHLEGTLRRKLRAQHGELFFARLILNFQILLCISFNGSCGRNGKNLELIERAYSLENFFNYLVQAHYFGAFVELDDIDFPDELEEKLRAYDISFVNGIDYDLYRICC